MTFDDMVSRVVSLYDVTTSRAADVVNERLQRMIAESKSLRAIKTIGTTVSGTASYTLDPTVVQILKAKVVYTDGQVNYDGNVTISDLWDVDADTASVVDGCAAFIVIEPDSDSSITTDSFRLYPVPAESGKDITGLVILRPAEITYGSSTALPIPADVEENLLAGAKAELADEDGRQDESAKFEVVYQAGIKKLGGQTDSRGVGSGGHRMKVLGYDIRR